MKWDIRQGHVLTVLKAMPASSVQCVVTSPPYWGLRSYKTEPQDWGDWTGELGLEPTPELFVQHIVEVFREVKRVLRDDGTLWMNLGDSYSGSGKGKGSDHGKAVFTDEDIPDSPQMVTPGLKPKDLVGIPWRVAFALHADGWYLRSDIIWAKPNPMPESVTDRPTKSHEYLFLLTKSPHYYFDQEAVRKPQMASSLKRLESGWDGNKKRDWPKEGQHNNFDRYMGKSREEIAALPGRNLRTVWTIPTQSFSEAHFATFPEDLVEPCLRAGTSEKGCCAKCGAPWEREVKVSGGTIGQDWNQNKRGREDGEDIIKSPKIDKRANDGSYHRETLGWHPTCSCQAETQPSLVLDPFCGSGTTGVVALKLNQDFLGIELQSDYIEMAKRRIGGVLPLFAEQILP